MHWGCSESTFCLLSRLLKLYKKPWLPGRQKRGFKDNTRKREGRTYFALGWWTNPGTSLLVLSLAFELALFSWNASTHVRDENPWLCNKQAFLSETLWSAGTPLLKLGMPQRQGSLQRCYIRQGEPASTGSTVMKRVGFVAGTTVLRKQHAARV